MALLVFPPYARLQHRQRQPHRQQGLRAAHAPAPLHPHPPHLVGVQPAVRPPLTRREAAAKWAERLFIAACTLGLLYSSCRRASDSEGTAPQDNGLVLLLQLFAAWHCLRFVGCALVTTAGSALRKLHRQIDSTVKNQLGGACELYYLALLAGALGSSHNPTVFRWPHVASTLDHADAADLSSKQLTAPLSSSPEPWHLGELLVAFFAWHVVRLLGVTLFRFALKATRFSSQQKRVKTAGWRCTKRGRRTTPRTVLRTGFKLLVCIVCLTATWSECTDRHHSLRPSDSTCCPSATSERQTDASRRGRRTQVLAARRTRKKGYRVLCRLGIAPPIGRQYVRCKTKGGAFNPYGSEGPSAAAEEPPEDFVDGMASDDEGPALACSSEDGDDGPDAPLWSDSEEGSDDEGAEVGDSDSTADTETGWAEALHERVIPPWDARLPEDHIAEWRAAEAALGIKRSVKGWLSAKKKKMAEAIQRAPPATPTAETSYVPAKHYTGSIPGFFFGTEGDRLGYHRLKKMAPLRTILLADELASSGVEEEAHQPQTTGKPTRRRRDEDGKRIRGKSRRWCAIRMEAEIPRILQDCQASEIGWRPPRGSGLWMIDSSNPNSWASGKRQTIKRTAADITVLQETKLRATRTERARRQAERLGWRAHFGPALVTAARGTSGGTAVTARKGLGSIQHEGVADGYQHRIAGAWVGAIQKGGIHVFSVYMKDGEGMGGTNAAILTQLAAMIAAVRGPWIVGGDWNMSPKTLTEANFPSIVKGRIHAPPQPTCNDKTYDYFLVSSDISDSVVSVKRLVDGGCKPHWTVRLYIHGAARAKSVRRLIKPDCIPGVLPHGPLNAPATYAGDAADVSLGGWYNRARLAWHSLLSTTPKESQHRFRWEAATGRTAHPNVGASAATALLRAMIRRLDDSMSLTRKGTPAEDSRIRANMANNVSACSKKELVSPEISLTAVRAWCTQADAAITKGELAKAEKLVATMTKKAKKMEDAESKARQKEWVKALTRTTAHTPSDSGHGKQLSKLAFRWIKGLAGWTRSSVGSTLDEAAIPDTEPGAPPAKDDTAASPSCAGEPPMPVPRSDQSEVDAIAKAWALLWQTNKEYVPPCFEGVEKETLEPLTVEDLLQAAASFPVTTGLGADNFSPRALLRLPRALVQELAELLSKAEDAGSWDETLSLVLIVLLPKDDGGHRPIGLFPSVIRIWMRARSAVAREWERETAGPEFFGCKGMGAQRAAWGAAFDAEAAAASGHDVAAALLDLVKAFEMIPHATLVKAARQSGFSLKVLRMSLAAYRIARTVGVDGVYSEKMIATRGITAGSGMATSELRLLLGDMVYMLKKMWPVALKLYVDDLTITATGDGHAAALAVAEATDFAVNMLQGTFELEVSVKKSVATANRPRVISTILAHCKSGALKAVTQAKLLGTAYTAGGRRAVQVMVARILKVKKIVGRVQQAARLGISAVEYVRSAAVPAMMYGCDIMGMSDSMVDDATKVAAAALTPPTAGKNPTLVMHAASVHSSAVNPSQAANLEPIKAWATAWWENWAQPTDLVRVFKLVKPKVHAAQPNHWSAVRGPAAALVATCIRLKWRSEDGRIFHDDVGAILDAKLDPPQAFADAAKRSVERLALDAVIEQLPASTPHGADVRAHCPFGAQNEREGGRRTVLVNLNSFLRPLYRGSAKIQSRLPQWAPACRGYLTSAINGGQWAQCIKAKLPGFSGTSKCQLCHNAEGTLQHRHYCTVTKPAQDWTPIGPDAMTFISSLPEPRARTLETRGVLTVRIPIADPQVPTCGWRWLSAPPDTTAAGLKWVIDGSRKYASHWTLSTTGCGVAVLDENEKLVAYATATPPPWVKTAGAAEAWALYLTLRECPGVPSVLTDCLGLLQAAKAGPAAATTAKKPCARIWRLISDLTAHSFKELAQQLVWMPAHTSAANATGRAKSDGRCLSTAEWRANQVADKLAKRGASSSTVRDESDKLIKAAGNALLQSAAKLGVVTHAANNVRVEFVRTDGTPGYFTKRDTSSVTRAQAEAKANKNEVKAAALAAPSTPAPAAAPPAAAPLEPITQAQTKARNRKLAATKRKVEEDQQLRRSLATATASSQPQTCTAAERRAALRARLGLAGGRPLPAATEATSSPAEETTWRFLNSSS